MHQNFIQLTTTNGETIHLNANRIVSLVEDKSKGCVVLHLDVIRSVGDNGFYYYAQQRVVESVEQILEAIATRCNAR